MVERWLPQYSKDKIKWRVLLTLSLISFANIKRGRAVFKTHLKGSTLGKEARFPRMCKKLVFQTNITN